MNQAEIYERCYAYERNRRYAAMVNSKHVGLSLAALKAIEAEVLADTSQAAAGNKIDPKEFMTAVRARTANAVRIYCAQLSVEATNTSTESITDQLRNMPGNI